MQPIRNLGEFTANVRLTMDLVPEIKIIVHREGEALEEPQPIDEVVADEPPAPEAVVAEVATEEPAEEETPAAEETETPAEAAAEETPEEDKE
jgi:hypothetical protein